MSNFEVGEQGFPEVADITLVLTETLGLSDVRRVTVTKSLLEGLALLDVAAPALNGDGQAHALLLTEALSLTDARTSGQTKQIGDSLGFTDDAQAFRPGLGVLTIVTVSGLGDSVGKGGGKA